MQKVNQSRTVYNFNHDHGISLDLTLQQWNVFEVAWHCLIRLLSIQNMRGTLQQSHSFYGQNFCLKHSLFDGVEVILRRQFKTYATFHCFELVNCSCDENGSFLIFSNLSLFLNGSKYCGSFLKNNFVVLVIVVVVGVLTNFYHIFKESQYFESLVETCPKRKIVVGAA